MLKKNVASLTIKTVFTEIQNTSWPSLTSNACELQRHWPASLRASDPAFSQQSRAEATRGRNLLEKTGWWKSREKLQEKEANKRTVQCFLTRRGHFSSWEHRSCAVLLLMLKTLSHRMWRLGSHSFWYDEGLFLAFYAHKGEKGLGRPPVCLKSAPLSGNGSSGSTWEVGNDLCDSVPAR